MMNPFFFAPHFTSSPTLLLSYLLSLISYSPTLLLPQLSNYPTLLLSYYPTILLSNSPTLLLSYTPTSPTLFLSYSPTILHSYFSNALPLLLSYYPTYSLYLFHIQACIYFVIFFKKKIQAIAHIKNFVYLCSGF